MSWPNVSAYFPPFNEPFSIAFLFSKFRITTTTQGGRKEKTWTIDLSAVTNFRIVSSALPNAISSSLFSSVLCRMKWNGFVEHQENWKWYYYVWRWIKFWLQPRNSITISFLLLLFFSFVFAFFGRFQSQQKPIKMFSYFSQREIQTQHEKLFFRCHVLVQCLCECVSTKYVSFDFKMGIHAMARETRHPSYRYPLQN